MFGKFTKWIPLSEYNFGETEYLILARRNIKSGMIYFKVKHVAGRMNGVRLAPWGLDIKEQFKELMKEYERFNV